MIRIRPLLILVPVAIALLLPGPADAQRRRRSAAQQAAQQQTREAATSEGFGDDPWGLADEPVRGDGALVTIVEFSDFECPYCARVNPTLNQLLADADLGPDTRLVFMQMPLPMHQHAEMIAHAAIEAHQQGLFWEFHDEVFARQSNLSDAEVLSIADDIGMDRDALEVALRADAHATTVDEHVALAGQLGIQGTPSFLINGRSLVGAQSFDMFAAAVRAERDAMQALIDGGATVADAYASRVAANQANVQP